MSRLARAQAYPARPVRIVVGFAPGGPADILARLMGQWLSERLGQPFVIENRPGGGGNIGTEAVVKAPPDGYTLLLATTANTINATLYDKLNFNFISDIAPVAVISRYTFVMVVHPSMPTKTVPEFIAYAKANPGKINMASGGIAALHVFGELFKMMTGVNFHCSTTESGWAGALAGPHKAAPNEPVQVEFQVILKANPQTLSRHCVSSDTDQELESTGLTRKEIDGLRKQTYRRRIGHFLGGWEFTIVLLGVLWGGWLLVYWAL